MTKEEAQEKANEMNDAALEKICPFLTIAQPQRPPYDFGTVDKYPIYGYCQGIGCALFDPARVCNDNGQTKPFIKGRAACEITRIREQYYHD